MNSINDRRQEILDGKTSWTAGEDAGGDFDVFFTQFVKPLRALRSAGMFDDLEEQQGHFDGGVRIFIVEITGAIDLDFPKVT